MSTSRHMARPGQQYGSASSNSCRRTLSCTFVRRYQRAVQLRRHLATNQRGGQSNERGLKRGGLQTKKSRRQHGRDFSRDRQNSIRNEAVDYFSLITVVLLVPLVLPTVPSSQTLVCLMRSSASTRLVKAIGPICVTTSLSAGRVVVIVQ
jgi:hypothetical protein